MFPTSSFLQIPPHDGHPCLRLYPSHHRADSGLAPVRNVRRRAHDEQAGRLKPACLFLSNHNCPSLWCCLHWQTCPFTLQFTATVPRGVFTRLRMKIPRQPARYGALCPISVHRGACCCSQNCVFCRAVNSNPFTEIEDIESVVLSSCGLKYQKSD